MQEHIGKASSAVSVRPEHPEPWQAVLLVLAAAAALATAFAPSLALVLDAWLTSEEYSHGLLMPVVGAYLLWQRWPALAKMPPAGTYKGFVPLACAVALAAIGVLAATQALTQYACLLALLALIYTALGPVWLRALLFPIALLALAIPLPAFIYNSLSLTLQLWSSALGVIFIRMIGITVFLDGNVIDLGALKLQVAEACNGLRYLFPMIALSVLMAYLYQAALWKRAILVLAALPIAVLMNGLRIAMIGYLVEHHGPSMAEGFVHDLQGWGMFMASFGFLIALVLVLERCTGNWRGFTQVLGVPAWSPAVGRGAAAQSGVRAAKRSHAPALLAVVLLGSAAVATTMLPNRTELIPQRAAFSEFSKQIGPWTGIGQRIDAPFLRALKLSDYLLMDFHRNDNTLASAVSPVSLYVAWYDSQRQGQAAHSPRSCLPGDGWEITALHTIELPSIGGVNRAVISKGEQSQLVYYWFEQRGRVVANEYAVKWWLFVDSLLRNRSDGALVRVTTTLGPGEPAAAADARMQSFLREAEPAMQPYLAQ